MAKLRLGVSEQESGLRRLRNTEQKGNAVGRIGK
jgi:hypothetical protein